MKKASKKQAQKSTTKVPRILSVGRLDFNFILNLSEELLIHFKIEWEKINEIDDLIFLKDNKVLCDKIQLSSSNSVLNTLMFINKTNSIKSFVEYITFSKFKFNEKQNFLKEMIYYVTEHNYLFLIEEDLINSKDQITLILKSGKNTKTFQILNSSNSQTELKKDEQGIFENLTADFGEYDYLLIDLEEIFFKFSTYPEILKEFKNLIEQKVLIFKNLKLIMIYPDIIKNVNNFSLDTVSIISNIISFADISIFEKKEALSIFNMFNQINNPTENLKELDEKDIHSYFMNEIKFVRSNINKLAIFINELNKINILEFKAEKLNYNNEYELNLYPKINHTNFRLVEDIKKLISNNYIQLRSAFLGGFFSRLLTECKVLSKEYFTSFFIGTESCKKILEIVKNKFEMPAEQEFYMVKVPRRRVEKESQKEELAKKEQRFVLDCINKQSSNLKYYNPLYDGNLNSFFASDNVRKQLKDKGFINTKGFIMYDYNYRILMGPSPKTKRVNEIEKEKHLIYAIKNIANEDPKNRSNLECYSNILKNNSPTNRKIPFANFEYTSPSKNYNTTINKKKLKPINAEVEKDKKISKNGKKSEKGNNTITVDRKEASKINNIPQSKTECQSEPLAESNNNKNENEEDIPEDQ